MEGLQLKSKALSFCDFRDIPLEGIIPPFEVDEAGLMRDILFLQKKNAVNEETGEVAEDDFVTFSCRSDNRRFQKNEITVRAGRGLFDRGLEAALVGMRKGEEREIAAGDDSVHVCILKIVRNRIPALTDENVAGWRLGDAEKAESVAGLKKLLINRQREEYINDTAEGMVSEVQRLVNEKSEFALDEAEVCQSAADGRALLWEMLKNNGIDPDTASGDEVKAATGMSTAEHIAYIEKVFLESFRSLLAGIELARQNHVVFTEKDYRKALEEQAAFLEVDEEEAEKKFTREVFLRQGVADWYFQLVEEHIKKYLREKE